MKVLTLVLAAGCALLLFQRMRATGDITEGVQAQWIIPGTEWLVHIRQYSRGWRLTSSNAEVNEEAQRQKIQCEFEMRVTVLEPQGEAEGRIARIQFTPLDDAPDFMRGSIRVLEIDATTGNVIAIKERTDDKGSGVGSVGQLNSEHYLFTEMYGFPTDWIICAADLVLVPTRDEDKSLIDKAGGSFIKKLRRAMTVEKHDAVEVEVATAWLDAEPSKKVVQTWVPGEGWWRSFTRYIQGHIDLEATLVDDKGE